MMCSDLIYVQGKQHTYILWECHSRFAEFPMLSMVYCLSEKRDPTKYFTVVESRQLRNDVFELHKARLRGPYIGKYLVRGKKILSQAVYSCLVFVLFAESR